MLLVACSADNPDSQNTIELTTSDLIVDIEGNPALNQELGVIKSSISDGSVHSKTLHILTGMKFRI